MHHSRSLSFRKQNIKSRSKTSSSSTICFSFSKLRGSSNKMQTEEETRKYPVPPIFAFRLSPTPIIMKSKGEYGSKSVTRMKIDHSNSRRKSGSRVDPYGVPAIPASESLAIIELSSHSSEANSSGISTDSSSTAEVTAAACCMNSKSSPFSS